MRQLRKDLPRTCADQNESHFQARFELNTPSLIMEWSECIPGHMQKRQFCAQILTNYQLLINLELSSSTLELCSVTTPDYLVRRTVQIGNSSADQLVFRPVGSLSVTQ